ncbi:MAG TPA: sigma-54 dependent transcriptional regulator [Polyangiaceae bacterium]|nr:sigma-54 dependent transcriptional regulator [Polyangiaceae bacterium]
MRSSPHVLVADDLPDVVFALRMLLKRAGMTVAEAQSPAEIAAAVEANDFDLVLMDLNYARDTTSGREGLDLLSRLLAHDPTLPVVVMTAWGSIEGAVEAMRRGARDYVQKPWDDARLLAALKAQVELRRAKRAGERLAGEAERARRQGLPELIASSPAMAPAMHLLERVGPSSANVLVTGEHGTGKEVVARWLHALSPRSNKPFVAVNAGALSEGVFESELFGHVKGAFTDAKGDRIGCFELADEGTLFLDEIGTMPASQQAKLLRVLQTGEFHPVGSSKLRRVDVRVVAATNVTIAEEVAAGRFRADLLYRLNTVEIRLPPLRERPGDLPPLAAHFLSRHAARYGKALAGFTPDADEALLRHAWPGNVRELEHAIERAVLLAAGERITADDLGLRRGGGGAAAAGDGAGEPLDEMTLEGAERHLIKRALERHGGRVVDAAKSLGVSRSALYRRLQALGLKAEE